MLPRLASSFLLKMTAVAAAGLACSPELFAQQEGGGPPVDAAKMLKELHAVLAQQSGVIKNGQGAAIQQVAAAAANPATAVQDWEEAIRMTQFEGAGHESMAFQAWKAADGQAFKEQDVLNALRLYFTWLQITIQRSAGAKVKDLLPAIVNYTRDLSTDQAAMGALEEAIKHEKEAGVGKQPVRGAKPRGVDLPQIKSIHDSILKKPLAGSIYVQWQKIMEWVNVEGWEGNPGNFDGIWEKVVLPEMRDERDPHLLDYWDMMLQKKADEANRSRLAFDVDKYNSIVVPALLWGKFGDMIIVGQKNQAYANMLSLIKKYPTHPDAKGWVSQFEELLAPPKPAAAAAPASASEPTAPVAAPVAPGLAPVAPGAAPVGPDSAPPGLVPVPRGSLPVPSNLAPVPGGVVPEGAPPR
jgi:hypothetical protein